MQFKRLGLVVLAGMAAGYIVACGEGEGTGDGTCSTDADCLTSEICHTVAKVCVQTCTSGSDCPDTAKNCAALPGATAATDAGASTDGGTTGAVKVCQCATTELCNSGNVGGSLVCNNETKVCEVKCTDDSGCSGGRTCDTVTGECKAAAATCSPACGSTQVCDTATLTCVAKCTWDSCTGSTNCNLTTGLCEAQAACNASTAQPDTCSYGQYCSTTNKCAWVPKATCSNFSGSTPAAWDPATGTGPIIYSITGTIAPNATWCVGGGDSVAAVVKAYIKPGSSDVFPSTKSALSGFFYVTVNGTQQDATTMMQNADYVVSAGGKAVTMTLHTGCYTSSTISWGMMSTTGNEFCSQISK